MESDLATLSVKLEDAQERVKFAQQLVKVDLQLAMEVSFPCLSLISLSLVGCISMLVFVFVGSEGDVVPQVPFSSRWSMPRWPSLSFS